MKFFTRDKLIAACKVADSTHRNRRIAWETLPKEQPAFPVGIAFVHNDTEMRVEIVCDSDGKTAWLDIPFKTYDKLPDVSLEQLQEAAAAA